MSTRLRRAILAAAACASALAITTSAYAEKPGGPPGHAKRGHPAVVPGAPGVTITISPHDQVVIRQYFGRQFAGGHCPPGLAKKNNGCLPPGQAKKWAQGRPLPAGLPYYPLPYDLLRRLSAPPPGYEYVRVANDVLLIVTGSRMVLDAVRDLGSM
jgi:hypothetical protein